MARHPHNTSRPTPKRVLAAVEAGDIDELENALTARQRAFCYEYVVDFQARNAAVRAGYAPKYADKQAHLLTMNRGVQKLIDHLTLSKEAKITSIDPDYVIAKVTEIITQAGTKDGDKLRGLELLARHLGMFVDRTEISGKDGEAIKYQEIEAEADDFARKIASIAKKSKQPLKAV